jgi:protein TonB
MHFSYSTHGGGSKVSKFALIAGLHLAVGVLLIHSMNTKSLSLPKLAEGVLVKIEPERPEPPPPPPAPPEPVRELPPPQLVVPQTDVEVAPPPDPVPLRASTEVPPMPPTTIPHQPVPDAPPAKAANAGNASSGAMRTAVLADANSCALPDYPARAARNGETGITMLALLVGADGRVQSARVDHSSGSRELDRAAVSALSLCRFKPATSNGMAEAGWAQLAYVWTLD